MYTVCNYLSRSSMSSKTIWEAEPEGGHLQVSFTSLNIVAECVHLGAHKVPQFRSLFLGFIYVFLLWTSVCKFNHRLEASPIRSLASIYRLDWTKVEEECHQWAVNKVFQASFLDSINLWKWPSQQAVYSIIQGWTYDWHELAARARHATILSRQYDYVIRPQSCLQLPFFYIYCGYPI